MPIQVSNLPTAGQIATRPRKEGVYDTEGYNGAAASPATLSLFIDARSFADTGLDAGTTKTLGLHTNLTGRGGQLPRGYHFYWYGIRGKVSYGVANLTTAANAVVLDEHRRMRDNSHIEFKFGTTPYIFAPFDEVPSGVGFGSVSTTHSATTVWPNSWGVPHRSNQYDVAVGQRPQELIEIEAFQVDFNRNEALTPTIDTYIQIYLTGVLLKGITG